MCGIAGIATSYGRTLSLDARGVMELSEAIAHRGPDSSGVWANGHVAMAHRRLSIIDTSPAGAQPMTTGESPEPRLVIAYNGELYNDAELRRELSGMGVRFRTGCDTETILRAIEVWGLGALGRFRGMFAMAFYDTRLRLLTLARDPLGIKPMYFARQGDELIFASEPSAILRHPRFSARPNLPMISAYSTTIRTVLGNETLFEGVKALAPGQMLRCDLSGDRPVLHLSTWWTADRAEVANDDSSVRAAVADSVARHLRSDVPTCALLSGGLDSTITATLAREHLGSLRTYCAGAESESDDDDLHHARRVAAGLGTRHAEAIIDQSMFLDRWEWMIERLGVPLSTPNEVAIHAVASRLRGDGCIVTISGEGADELFGGYAVPLDAAQAYIDGGGEAGGVPEFEIASNAWIPPEFKPGVFHAAVLDRAGHDDDLRSFYMREVEQAIEEGGPEGYSLRSHLRLQRRINLTGLLGRLDTATMLAGVEGRTPLADVEILRLADSLPLARKFLPAPSGDALGGVAVGAAHRTKIALREAFSAIVPAAVLEREKASFPLPFQTWVAPRAAYLRDSRFARQLFRSEAIEAVCGTPERHWAFAWPMLNLAIWGERWWG